MNQHEYETDLQKRIENARQVVGTARTNFLTAKSKLNALITEHNSIDAQKNVATSQKQFAADVKSLQNSRKAKK